MSYSEPLKLLKNLPKKLNNFYNKNSRSSLKINNKSKDRKIFDPVTNLDKAFEKFIRNIIVKQFPKDAILGEEFSEKLSNNDYKWFIDPIDGTRAFMIGAPTWSNLIGLTHKNQSALGLANFPALNKFYINDQKRSYLINNKKTIIRTSKESDLRRCKIIGHVHETLFQKKSYLIDNKTTILKTSKETNLKKSKVIGHLHEWVFLNKYNKQIKKVMSSVSYFGSATFDALNFCLLAEGKIEAVIETNLKPFDIVPLIPIVEKAGGVVSTWNNMPAIKGGNILATSNKKLHQKILKMLSGTKK